MSDQDGVALERLREAVRQAGLPLTEAQMRDLLTVYDDIEKMAALVRPPLSMRTEPALTYRAAERAP